MEHKRAGDCARGDVASPFSHTSLAETVDSLRVQLDHLAMQVRGNEAETGPTSQQVRSILRARICRQEFLKAGLFAEPAWDILLELFARDLEHRRASVSELYRASGVPETTAHRWIDNLEKEGLTMRRDDQFDGRRVWVSLSPKGRDAMQRYFEALPVRLLPR